MKVLLAGVCWKLCNRVRYISTTRLRSATSGRPRGMKDEHFTDGKASAQHKKKVLQELPKQQMQRSQRMFVSLCAKLCSAQTPLLSIRRKGMWESTSGQLVAGLLICKALGGGGGGRGFGGGGVFCGEDAAAAAAAGELKLLCNDASALSHYSVQVLPDLHAHILKGQHGKSRLCKLSCLELGLPHQQPEVKIGQSMLVQAGGVQMLGCLTAAAAAAAATAAAGEEIAPAVATKVGLQEQNLQRWGIVVAPAAARGPASFLLAISNHAVHLGQQLVEELCLDGTTWQGCAGARCHSVVHAMGRAAQHKLKFGVALVADYVCMKRKDQSCASRAAAKSGSTQDRQNLVLG
eukprot:1161380-Pelagomonas_calceolata.AAC.11